MNPIRANFTRLSPSAFNDQDNVPAAWFVVSFRWLSDKKQRRMSHGRWCRISSDHLTIYRILRFSPYLRGGENKDEGQIVIDWPGWIDLCDRAEEVDAPLRLTITPARWWEYPKLAVAHPDPTHRLAGQLGLVSVALGLLSIVLALV